MTRRSRPSTHWRQKQTQDPYVRRAASEGWRSRAVFKLAQIDARERLFQRGMTCIDLGAAPGGWSQYVARAVGQRGRVIAVDLKPMQRIAGVSVIEGDFTEQQVLERVLESLEGRLADIVMSDMAPNITGMRAVDQPRAMQLAEDALASCSALLKPGGRFLAKLFQGEGFEGFVGDLRRQFRSVRAIKPKASRPESREIYLLARGYGV